MRRRAAALAVPLVLALLLTACGTSTPTAGASPSSGATARAQSGSEAGASSSTGLRLGPDWPTYHGAVDRRGAVPGPAPSRPSVAWRAGLDGKVYASPLVVGGRVLAATEGGSLYALDGATGRVVWRRHLGDPVRASALPCGNIDPVGVTGTPVYDPATRTVFAVVTTLRSGAVRHRLVGVDVATGRVRSDRAADAPGSDPRTHLQRGALLLSRGRVYVPYGGNAGDCGQYVGRVVSLPSSGSGPLQSFAVPTRREAGIWAASGPAATPAGEVVVTTGNGEASSGAWDRSDSVLRLGPDLRLRDGFAPTGWAQENSVDADLGSTGPLLLPGGRRVLAAGKGGSVYLVDVARLGGVGGQLSRLSGCRAFGGSAAVPAPGGSTAFVPCADGLLQVRVTGDRLVRGWKAPSDVTGSPVVVGTTVWSVQQDGTLDGLDAGTGRQRARVEVGAATRFASPAASGGALLVPTEAGVTAVRLQG